MLKWWQKIKTNTPNTQIPSQYHTLLINLQNTITSLAINGQVFIFGVIVTIIIFPKAVCWNIFLPFLRKLLRWVFISISQSLSIELWLWDSARWRGNARGDHAPSWTSGARIHLPFWAFCADLVTLPPPAVFLSTALMTPTATVRLMSRTAKRPVRVEEEWCVWLMVAVSVGVVRACVACMCVLVVPYLPLQFGEMNLIVSFWERFSTDIL